MVFFFQQTMFGLHLGYPPYVEQPQKNHMFMNL